jgi:predicted metal-dependent phosphoesterase TrpH
VIDLHTHSTASDGSHPPEELVAMAAAAGVEHLALTDHDTTAGLDAAAGAAARHGIHLLPGIELSATWGNRTLHIVGLAIDPANPRLDAAVRTAADTRYHRAVAIGRSLGKAGIPGAFNGARNIAGSEANLSRSHFARFLVEQGHARDSRQVFRRFMVRGKPGYARSEWITLQDAVAVIHAAGGVAVLAHPARYKVTAGRLRRIIDDFGSVGGDALEVSCGGGSTQEVGHLARLATEHGLAASLGSDFHGPDKPWARLGRLHPLPDSVTSILALIDKA